LLLGGRRIGIWSIGYGHCGLAIDTSSTSSRLGGSWRLAMMASRNWNEIMRRMRLMVVMVTMMVMMLRMGRGRTRKS